MDTEIYSNAHSSQGDTSAPQATPTTQSVTTPTKFCKHCGQKINEAAVVCPHCGCQVETLRQDTATAQPNIVINNSNANTNTNTNTNINAGYVIAGKPKNKWIAVLLCLFLGLWGGHKFYEGKVGMGILYIFTAGLFGIGLIVDLIRLLLKPNPYFVL